MFQKGQSESNNDLICGMLLFMIFLASDAKSILLQNHLTRRNETFRRAFAQFIITLRGTGGLYAVHTYLNQSGQFLYNSRDKLSSQSSVFDSIHYINLARHKIYCRYAMPTSALSVISCPTLSVSIHQTTLCN